MLRPRAVLSATEEFYDPDHLFLPETTRPVEAAGLRCTEHLDNRWVHMANFRKVG